MSLFSNLFPLKTFILEDQETSKSISIQYPLDQSHQQVYISSIIRLIAPQLNVNDQCIFQIYDPNLNTYIKLDKQKRINNSFFASPVIMLKYRKQLKNNIKKERNKQKTIRQVIELVKKWRRIYNDSILQNNKITLNESAKIIGISKKSLDDYFCQLRLGQMYNFNFNKHIDEKIGLLRSFVKDKKPKLKKGKNQKYPITLKIIEVKKEQEEQCVSNLYQQAQINQSDKKRQNQNEQQQVEQITKSYQQNYQNLQSPFQKQFIKSFLFDLNQPDDPFIPYNHQNYRNNGLQQLNQNIDFLFS